MHAAGEKSFDFISATQVSPRRPAVRPCRAKPFRVPLMLYRLTDYLNGIWESESVSSVDMVTSRLVAESGLLTERESDSDPDSATDPDDKELMSLCGRFPSGGGFGLSGFRR